MKTILTENISRKITGLFALFLIVTHFASAQASFRMLNGGSEFDYGNCIIQTPDKGMCVIGSTNSLGSGNYDVYVIKLDSNAVMQWSKTFDWGKNEFGLNAVITNDRGIAITGYSNITNFSDSLWDGFVLKLDMKGKVLWSKTIGGDSQDIFNGIIETGNGDLVVAGSTLSFGKGKNDIYMARLSAQGSLIWTKTMGSLADDIAYSVTLIKNGFAIAGVTANGFMPFVAKCDTHGKMLWGKIIAGSTSAIGAFNAIVKTADKGFALTGYTKTRNQGYDVIAAKITTKGDLEWCVTSGNAGDDKGNSVIEDKNGNIVITGYADYARTGFAQSLYMIKIAPDNTLVWSKTITEQSDAIGSSVIEWKNNGYAVTGSAWLPAGGFLYKPELYLSEFDTSGDICGASLPQNSLDFITPYTADITFDTSAGGDIEENMVTQYEGSDFTSNCISLQSPVAVNTSSTVASTTGNTKGINVTITPNPVNNGILSLRFNNTSSGSFQVSIVNMQGSNMLSFKVQATGKSYNKNINISELPNGMYILKVNDGSFQQSVKFIKAN